MIQIRAQQSLGEFDLDVNVGSSASVIGIVGPSGAGKTTLLSAIAGASRTASASVRIDNVEIAKAPSGAAIPPSRRGIGYVFQDALLFPHMTVRRNLLYAFDSRRSHVQPEEAISLLELGDLLDRRPHEISGGEQRRVAVGRAILAGPRLLLLDEPLTGLDRARAGRMLALLGDLRRRLKLPILYASHDLSSVQFLCDETWVIRDGRVVQTCPAQETLLTAVHDDRRPVAPFTNLVRATCTNSEQGIAAFALGSETIRAVAATREGEEAILAIRSTEIILAVADPGPLSARNILAGTITRIDERAGAPLVCIDVGALLWVQITSAAAAELALAPGRAVRAIVKASAVSALSGTSHSAHLAAEPAASSEANASADTP